MLNANHSSMCAPFPRIQFSSTMSGDKKGEKPGGRSGSIALSMKLSFNWPASIC